MDEKIEKPEGNLFPTKDIYFAAALHSLGIYYDGVDKSDKEHQVFMFIGKNIDEFEKQWIRKELIGNISLYAESVRTFKSIIHK